MSENWRYAHPDHPNVVIITSYEYPPGLSGGIRVQAVIAEDRTQGNKIFLKSRAHGSHEHALRDLLCSVTKLVGDVIKDTPATALQVKHLNQINIKTNDYGDKSEKEVKKPKQSPKDEELKVSHDLYHSFCNVINLRFQKLNRWTKFWDCELGTSFYGSGLSEEAYGMRAESSRREQKTKQQEG